MALTSAQITDEFSVGDRRYQMVSLPKAIEATGHPELAKLPISLKVLLENLLRHMGENGVGVGDIDAMAKWVDMKTSRDEIAYHPARVLMQDFTGVPAVVDLASMRDAMQALGGHVETINPQCSVDLVIDHSVQVDRYGQSDALVKNLQVEMERNHERYQFLKWGQEAFANFRAVPPDTGICHQVNLEYLAKVVWHDAKTGLTYPDTLVGTDSHTTMINGLGVLGWGVGGIEAEAAMLGQPVSMLIPEVIGVKLTGQLPEGATATDLVLTLVEMLRARGVVGKFVEYFGEGLTHLTLAERATIANMAPEYGATCGFFPVDDETLNYLRLTGRDAEHIAMVEAYVKAQGMWHMPEAEARFTDVLRLDLSTVETSLAGPKRPQDRVVLSDLKRATAEVIKGRGKGGELDQAYGVDGLDAPMHHGDVVIAAITSCTNTSNPGVLVAAGLLAKKAVEKGLATQPWVKTSLAPGSKVVMRYLEACNLIKPLEALGFYLVGYGCTTCIGNSGPLSESITQSVQDNDLVVSSVLSGNRNFEGRIHPLTTANWLASPPLVVAFAIAGTTHINLASQPLGQDQAGQDVMLKDIWPSSREIAQEMARIDREMFIEQYRDVFAGDAQWQAIETGGQSTYTWDSDSTYVRRPSFFEGMPKHTPDMKNIENARVLALLGDSVTTDHISPAGSIAQDSPAGLYLKEHGVPVNQFNSYGSRRGNHEVMMRGTFANIRIHNEMVPGVEGGYTRYLPTDEILAIYDAAMRYQQDETPLVVIAGREYGTGSSRDWAAKGTLLLGVKAVIAESFERIHRSNLIGMGVLPLQFLDGESRKTHRLMGSETISVTGLGSLQAQSIVQAIVVKDDGSKDTMRLLCRIDTDQELDYYRHRGILQMVLRKRLEVSNSE